MTALRQKSTRRNPLSLSHEVCSHSLSEHKPIYCWCLNYCERHVFSKNQMPCLNTIHAVMILVKSNLRVCLIKCFAFLTCPWNFIMWKRHCCEIIFICWTFNFVNLVGRANHKFKIQTNYFSLKSNVSYNLKFTNSSVLKHVHRCSNTKFGAHEITWFHSICLGSGILCCIGNMLPEH